MRWSAAAGRTSYGSGRSGAVVTILRLGWPLHYRGPPTRSVRPGNSPMVAGTTGWDAVVVSSDEIGYSFKNALTIGVTTTLRDCSPVDRPVAGCGHAGSCLRSTAASRRRKNCVDVPDKPENADFSGGAPKVAASSPRSRKRDGSRWPNAARTRSSTRAGPGRSSRSRWHERWQGGGAGSWCSRHRSIRLQTVE